MNLGTRGGGLRGPARREVGAPGSSLPTKLEISRRRSNTYYVRPSGRQLRFASTEALGYCAAVVECLDRLPKTDEREKQRIDLRLAEAEMIWVQGRYEEGLRILEEIQAIAERLRDDERLAQIHFISGWFLYDQLELDRAFEHQQECFRLCQRLGNLETMRRVYWGLGQSCRALSDDIGDRRAKAIEFHHAGLRLGEAAESAQFFDVHNAHFLGSSTCSSSVTGRRRCAISSAPKRWPASFRNHCTWLS